MVDRTVDAHGRITMGNVSFVAVSVVLLLITHAIAYLTHEYAHTIMAWALGWMAHPLGIDYGHATLYNVLFLDDVGDNVDYAPIFASGHGYSAAAIALSGPFLGNGLLYFLIYGVITRTPIKSSRLGTSFLYWLSLMCAANVWGYVPLRAITTHADIALAAQGLQVSPWTLFPFVLVPSALVIWHFFFRMFQSCFSVVTDGSILNVVVMVTLTAYWFFSFFGGDGITGNYGLISQILCIASKYLLLPYCVLYLVSRYVPHCGDGVNEAIANHARR